MATEIKVPTLGESVTSATVARWMKHEGDSVVLDEPLVELETDKVTVEVNAPAAGVLTSIAVSEGGEVEVGALLATLEAGGKPAASSPAATAVAPSPAATATAPSPAATAAVPSGAPAPSALPPAPAAISAQQERGPISTPPTASASEVAELEPVAAGRAAANPPAGVNPPPRPLGPVSRPAGAAAQPLTAAAKLMEEQHLA
ncbi:MAG TPA: biotin/lipoyl-containing protein, partial [Acetobacteraceae bacterium]